MPAEPSDDFTITLRSAQSDDRAYLISSFLEEYKYSSGRNARSPWGAFRRQISPLFCRVLDLPRTRILVAAAPDGRIAGWLAYTPGTQISTVHWAHTRAVLGGEKLRRRGVMTMLLEAASLGSRFVYTFKGPLKRKTRPGAVGLVHTVSAHSAHVDEPIAAWLRGRGVTAVYLPIEEWMK